MFQGRLLRWTRQRGRSEGTVREKPGRSPGAPHARALLATRPRDAIVRLHALARIVVVRTGLHLVFAVHHCDEVAMTTVVDKWLGLLYVAELTERRSSSSSGGD